MTAKPTIAVSAAPLRRLPAKAPRKAAGAAPSPSQAAEGQSIEPRRAKSHVANTPLKMKAAMLAATASCTGTPARLSTGTSSTPPTLMLPMSRPETNARISISAVSSKRRLSRLPMMRVAARRGGPRTDLGGG
jgi:hypothetical protein